MTNLNYFGHNSLLFTNSRHSVGPRFSQWPTNQDVLEGETVAIECTIDNCNSAILSKDFIPVSEFNDSLS